MRLESATMMKQRHSVLHRVNLGFTLVEVVVVVVIITLITTSVGLGMSRALAQQMLNNDVEIVVSAIQRARSFTLASKGVADGTAGKAYGVKFPGGISYEIYYSIGSEDTPIETQTLTATTLSSTDKIMFKRLTGDVVLTGTYTDITITLTSKRISTLKRIIKVSQTGIIEVQ